MVLFFDCCEVSVDPGAEVCCFEERGLSVACRVVFGASLTHPCFAGALEVRFDFGLRFICQVHIKKEQVRCVLPRQTR